MSIKILRTYRIKTNEDVNIAMKLGAGGFAISSAITKAKNPGLVLKKLKK